MLNLEFDGKDTMKIGLIPSFFFNFSWEAYDTRPLLRQRRERAPKSVAKQGDREIRREKTLFI
jgi:hypothetical protein